VNTPVIVFWWKHRLKERNGSLVDMDGGQTKTI